MRVFGGAVRAVCLLALVVLSGLLWRGALDEPDRVGRGFPPRASPTREDAPVISSRREAGAREAATRTGRSGRRAGRRT